MMRVWVGVLALSVCGQVWAVNKCTGPDGRVFYQDAACPGQGQALEIRPSSAFGGPAPAVVPRAAPAPTAPEPAAAAEPAQPAPPVVVRTALELEADMCLAWYRPLLRDPQGAYHTNASKAQRVLSMDLHATNGFGGYVVKRASCEIHNGRLNEDWTRIHARRAGWISN